MIKETQLSNGLSLYKSDLDLKINIIEKGIIYNSIIDKSGQIDKYEEVKEFINTTPAYAEEAVLYKTLLDTISGDTGGEE